MNGEQNDKLKIPHCRNSSMICTKPGKWEVFRASILPLSMILQFDFVPTVWYFRTVPTVWYFRTVPTVWYFRTVPTVWYFRTVPTVWYFRSVPTVWVFFVFHFFCNNWSIVGVWYLSIYTYNWWILMSVLQQNYPV
jgi:hypothetical protein